MCTAERGHLAGHPDGELENRVKCVWWEGVWAEAMGGEGGQADLGSGHGEGEKEIYSIQEVQ